MRLFSPAWGVMASRGQRREEDGALGSQGYGCGEQRALTGQLGSMLCWNSSKSESCEEHSVWPINQQQGVGAGCLSLSTVAIWGQAILCYGGCPVCYRMLSSTPGFCSVDASSVPNQ